MELSIISFGNFSRICLNSSSIGKTTEGEEEIGIKCGDIITWKETNTKWIIFLQYLEEDAYFRAQIRKCEQNFVLNDKLYWVYVRGPVETSINWNQKGGIEWNDLNFSLVNLTFLIGVYVLLSRI